MAETLAPVDRTLPHNLEAERSVLGAILVHNDAFNLAAQVIDGRDFYRDAHRRIFDRMVALNERNSAIDFVTLKEELARNGELDEVGGPAYVASLSDGVLTLSYAPQKRFLRGRAEGRRDRIAALAADAYGSPLQVAFADLDADATLREVWKD